MKESKIIECTSSTLPNDDMNIFSAPSELKYDIASMQQFGLKKVEDFITQKFTNPNESESKAIGHNPEFAKKNRDGFAGNSDGMRQLNTNMDKRPNVNIPKSIGRSSGKKP